MKRQDAVVLTKIHRDRLRDLAIVRSQRLARSNRARCDARGTNERSGKRRQEYTQRDERLHFTTGSESRKRSRRLHRFVDRLERLGRGRVVPVAVMIVQHRGRELRRNLLQFDFALVENRHRSQFFLVLKSDHARLGGNPP